jgi:hypothetical protein
MQSWSKQIPHDLTFHIHLNENTHNENHLNISSFFFDFTQRRLIVTDVSSQLIFPIFNVRALTLEMGPIGCSETLVITYQST